MYELVFTCVVRFLLTASAFTMGAVAIWSMHFIGNNSMTLWANDRSYQLSYKSGYTFASLMSRPPNPQPISANSTWLPLGVAAPK